MQNPSQTSAAPEHSSSGLPGGGPAGAGPGRRASFWERLVPGLWGVALLAVLIRAGLAPHQQSVFSLFRRTGARWLAGEDCYRRVGEFLYSPLAAAFFSPLALLPERAAGVLWRLVNAAAFLGAAGALLRRPWAGGAPLGSAARALGLLVLLPLSLGNFNNGQVSPLVIALVLGAVLAAGGGRWNLAAAGIAAAAFFKVYPLAVGLLLVALYPRQLGWRLAAALAAGFVLSLLVSGPGYGWDQYQRWLACLGADKRRTHGAFGTWRDAWLLLRLARVPITTVQYAVVQALAGAAGAAFCWWGQRVRGWGRERLLVALFGLGCGWMTLFGPSTEAATYVLLAPFLAFAVAVERGRETPPLPGRALLWAAVGLLVISEAFNAWVPAARRNIYFHALQPLGALASVAFLVVWTRRDAWWGSQELPLKISRQTHSFPGPSG